MKNLLLTSVIALIFSFENANAQQVSVTNFSNTTPALADGYPSLAAAISDLQLITAISGPVIITLNAANPETAPQGGYVIRFAATTNASTAITIAGSNNIITAFSHQATGSVNDAIFKIVGADYITIQNFNMQENAANTTSTAATNDMTEWGIALLNTSPADGAQHNTIENNSISLNRNYSNSFGIYSNTNHSATDVTTNQPITNPTTAPNNNNKVYGNTISNVNMGIAFTGSAIADYMDEGNDIGGIIPATGNTITNWGGMIAETGFIANAASSYCILVNHQKNENVSYNTITSAVISGTTVALRGILKDYFIAVPTGTFTSIITNNTITIKDNFATATSFECINSQGITTALPTATINISNNNIFNNELGNIATPIGSKMTGIINSSVCGVLNMNGNIFRGNNMVTPNAAFTAISNLALVTGVININNNHFGDALGNCLTLPASSWNSISAVWCEKAGVNAALSISGNNIQGFVHLGISSNPYYFIYFEHQVASAVTDNFNDNVFTNLYLNTNEVVYFIIRNGGNMEPFAGATMNYNNNKVIGVFNKSYAGTWGVGVVFIQDYGTSGTGNKTNITGNDFSNVSILGDEGGTNGINSNGGGVTTIANNFLRNWDCGGHFTTFINCNADSSYITNNTIRDVLGTSRLEGISVGANSLVVCSNNIISGMQIDGPGGAEMLGIICRSTDTTKQYINNNVISNFSSGDGAMTAGIRIIGSGTGAAITNVFKNKIYHLSGSHISASAIVVGVDIPLGSSGTNNIFNNTIGDLVSSNTNNANAIRGINILSVAPTAIHNIYYNTIYLAAPVSSGTNFGTSGIYATADASSANGALTLRNNIIVNLSAAKGSGVTAVFRRSASALANYSAASNNNIFYAGTPSATNVMLRYATTSFQTLAAYKTKVNPADINSFTELPPFLNIATGDDPGYLHINAATLTQAESGAVNIPGIQDDIDAEIRQGNPGYAGTGSAPDIGADEFDGFIVVPVSITAIAATRTSDKTIIVKWKGENEINLEKYILEKSANGENFTMIGSKEPVANNGGTANYQYYDMNAFVDNNFYRIKSTSLDGRIQYSAIVKVGPLAEPGSITVYPNPVKDKILNIHFVNQPAGMYKLQIVNKLGQVVYSGSIEIDGSNFTRLIKPGNNIAEGNYLLKIYSEKEKITVLQVFFN